MKLGDQEIRRNIWRLRFIGTFHAISTGKQFGEGILMKKKLPIGIDAFEKSGLDTFVRRHEKEEK